MWTIYHSPGTFTVDQRATLSTAIADYYQGEGLPRFYVITLFREVGPDDFYVGGEPAIRAVRLVVNHVARRAEDGPTRRRIAARISDVLVPLLARDPDLHWELHIDETSEDLWRINGLVPPPANSDEEKRWAAANAVSRWERPGGAAGKPIRIS